MPRKEDFSKRAPRLSERIVLHLLKKANRDWDSLSDKEKDRVVTVLKHITPKRGVEKRAGKKYEDYLDELKGAK